MPIIVTGLGNVSAGRLRDRSDSSFTLSRSERDRGNVNSFFFSFFFFLLEIKRHLSFVISYSFSVVAGTHSIIIMRDAQLDRVYIGGRFKCHRAGPDISLLDM